LECIVEKPSELEVQEEEITIPISMEVDTVLVNVTMEKFNKDEQKKCDILKPLWALTSQTGKKEFEERTEKLVWVSQSKQGKEVVQLCVPNVYWQKLLALYHEKVSGHLNTI
jgi:hypothetical protein